MSASDTTAPTKAIRVEYDLPHPPPKVWRAHRIGFARCMADAQ
jgi:hypothetical protein